MNHMELRVLRYFLTIAREENITRAADILHITQPTLSRQMMQLEEELGIKLFQRGAKFSLTDKGLLLRRRAEEILELSIKAEREIKEDSQDVGGTIYLGGGETFAMHSWGRVIKKFSDSHPGVNFDFYSGNADDLKERMDNGLIDMALLIEPVDIEKYDFIRLAAVEKFGLLMNRDSPLAAQASVCAEDLIDKPLILSRRNLVQKQMVRWFGRQYKSLNIIATYNLIYNAAILVEENLGSAFVLEHLVPSRENLCFRPLEPPMEVGVVIAWKKYQIFSPAARLFLEKVKEELSV